MDPKHAQVLKVRKGLAHLLFDNAGLALVINLVNGLMWELVIWSSLGSTVVFGRYACLGLVTLLRWRTVLANRRCEQTWQQAWEWMRCVLSQPSHLRRQRPAPRPISA